MRIKEYEKELNDKKKEYQEFKENYYRLQEQNREYEHEINELNTQLTISLQAREALYKKKIPTTSTSSYLKYKKNGGDEDGDDLDEESVNEEEINDIINEIHED